MPLLAPSSLALHRVRDLGYCLICNQAELICMNCVNCTRTLTADCKIYSTVPCKMLNVLYICERFVLIFLLPVFFSLICCKLCTNAAGLATRFSSYGRITRPDRASSEFAGPDPTGL